MRRLRWRAYPADARYRHSRARTEMPTSIHAICTSGTWTMGMINGRARGDGWIPPGFRTVPPIKSQKNLRKKIPQKLAHTEYAPAEMDTMEPSSCQMRVPIDAPDSRVSTGGARLYHQRCAPGLSAISPSLCPSPPCLGFDFIFIGLIHSLTDELFFFIFYFCHNVDLWWMYLSRLVMVVVMVVNKFLSL